MQIYIRKDNEDFGPYSREAVLEYVKKGVFRAYDRASYTGASDWKALSELLGIAAAPQPPVAVKARAAAVPVARGATTRAPVMPRPSSRRPWVYGETGEKKRGHMILLNLLLIGIVALAVWVRLGGGGPTAQHYMMQIRGMFGSPAVDSTQASSPAPAIAQQPVAPAPLPLAPPQPATPRAFSPASLAGNPAAWPKTLKLQQAANFPAVLNGQTVGSITVPAGTEVELVKIQGDQLILNYQGGMQTLPWSATDIQQRIPHTDLISPAGN